MATELHTYIAGLTEDTTPDVSADFVVTRDTSATAAKKVKPSSILGTYLTAIRDGLSIIVPKTSAYPVVVADSGKKFTNEGAGARVDFTLPTAAANLSYSFIVQDTDGIRVIAAAGDTIRIAASVSATAGRIDATAIGSAVHITAINATEWIAESMQGVWTVT